jgi:hypothetical protein
LGEFGFGFDAEAAGVVEKFVDGLVGDFSVEEFADAGLRLGEDELEFFLGVFFGDLQDGLVEFGFEPQGGGVFRGKAEIIENVSGRYVGWSVRLLFHVWGFLADRSRRRIWQKGLVRVYM